MHHLLEHWGDVLTGAIGGVTIWSIVAYAVNTAPTPEGKYGQWILGIIKFAVGQKLSALNAIRGQDTLIAPVPRGAGTGSSGTSAATTKVEKTSVDVGEDTIVLKDMHQSTTVIPKPKEGE